MAGFQVITEAKSNDETITKKSYWATKTYIFVALALMSYLGLTALLYPFSIPKTQVNSEIHLQSETKAPATGRADIKPIISTPTTPQTSSQRQ
jgi:hypothetical protein